MLKTIASNLLIALLILPGVATAQGLNATFADSAWTGDNIPKGQHCEKDGGNGATPPLAVSGIPAGANAIVLEFNDESFFDLSKDGGHGKIGFLIPNGASQATLKAVSGGTNRLPEGTWLVRKNQAWGAWDSDGYLPPCSGGQGNTYSAEVIAVTIDPASKNVQRELARTKITLGRY